METGRLELRITADLDDAMAYMNDRNAMEEQGEESKQILNSIGQLNEISGKNREGIDT